ncbi:TP901 family phage tail tape measure protein [Pseudomonas migulae]|uniref:phage tail tape measure protein n=1 Tax=Pseudomonas migulae TaxID=78543 RepID=UPI00209F216D|nr:phage tail tape measure protein [Pseudomonas migulae]MCP1496219.1 TP901 family phage tail tape measure protein [Pseudomonas migulae]
MADVSKTIEIAFKGIDNLSPTARSAGDALSGFSRTSQSITGPLAGVADGVLKLNFALSALAVAVIAYTTKQGMELQDSQFDLQKQLKDSEGSVSQYSGKIEALGTTFGKSNAEITRAVGVFSQAGFSISDSLKLAEVSLKATIAGDMELKDVTEKLIASMAGFGIKVKDTGKFMDILNNVSNNSGASMAELMDAFAKAGSAASASGLSLEEYAASAAMIIEVNRSGSETGNMLKAVIANLANPTKEQSELFKKLGISFTDSNGKLKDGSVILAQYGVANAKLTKNEQLRNNAVVAGTEHFATFGTLFADVTKKAKVYEAAINSAGSMDKEFAVAKTKASFALDGFSASLTNLSAKIGLKYIEETKGVIGANASLVNSFSTVVDGANFSKLLGIVKEFSGAVAGEINKLAASFPKAFEMVNLDGFQRALRDLQASLGTAFSIDLNDPKAVASAIQFVVDSIESLVDVTSGMVKQFGNAWTQIKAGIQAFNGLDIASKQSSGEILGIAKVANTALKALEGLGDGLSAIGTGLSALALGGVVKKLLDMNDGAGKSKASVKGLADMFGTLGTGAAVAGGKVIDALNPEKWNLKKLSTGLTDLMGKMGGLNALTKAGIFGAAAAAGGASGIWLYENVEVVRKGMDGLRDSVMNYFGYTNEAQLATELLADSFKNAAPMIEKYKNETGDTTITMENHRVKLDAWIAKKKEDSEATLKAAAAMKESGDKTKESTEKLEENKTALDESSKSAETAASSTKELTLQTSLFKDVKITDFLKEMNDGMSQSAGVVATLGGQFNGIGDRLNTLNGLLVNSGHLSKENAAILKEQIEDEREYRSETIAMQKDSNDLYVEFGEVLLDIGKYFKELLGIQDDTTKSATKNKEATDKQVESLKKSGDSASSTGSKMNQLKSSIAGVASASQQGMGSGIDDIKSSAEMAKASIEGLSSSFSSTGDRLNNLTDALLKLDDSDTWARDDIIDAMKEETKMRSDLNEETLSYSKTLREIADIKRELSKIQLEELKNPNSRKTEIKISAEGLEPSLAMVLTNIVEKAQITATREGQNLLIGLSK